MLKGDRVHLRPINQDDLETLRSFRNRYKDQFFSGETISKEQQKNWYERYAESHGRDYMFMVEKNSGEPIGTIALYGINITDRTGEVGRVLLLEEFRGKGYMEEALGLLLDLAFNHMRLWKVRVYAYLDNLTGLSLYEKAGFSGAKRPIVLLERTNDKFDPKKPLKIETYDDLGGDAGYEGQCSNIS